MAASDDQRSTATVPADLLPLIRRSGIVDKRQFEEVRDKIQSGEYPRGSSALAERLVAEQILTEFQASRLLRNKYNGFVVGGYVVLARLGEGNKGRVFKAQHKLMGRLVALKIIAPQIASRASSIARFHREMRLLGRLDHPNVVRAFDADQVGDLLYIVMEYVAGRDLERLLQDRGELPWSDVAAYMADAALGLSHAHDRGIVHRDVKPTNLILSEDGQVKVLDLGLGVLMEADSETSFATAAGHSVGTLNYMSPEQATASDVDGRSDLFSLGCTMYHLLTGQVPFPGETVVECLTRRARGSPVPITDFRPDLPAELVGVLNRLMANRPEHRFQTAAEAAQALQEVARHGKADARTGPQPPPRAAMHSSAPETHASRAVRGGAESRIAGPCASPGPSPSPWSRSFLAAAVAAWPFVRASLVPLIVGLLIFIVGFALGHASAIMLLHRGH
jgi:serine/threonine-protein kinase